jgi:uncharacterized repeat protein (TIGR04076 family)
MDKEKMLKRFQQHMGYNDQEMEVFKSDPTRVKMVTETPEFVKKRIIAEVVESHSCHAGHNVGQKFIMDGNGQLISRECPAKMCVFAVSALEPQINVVYSNFINHTDPKNEWSAIAQCSDIGLDKGGWGKVLMKIYAEDV